MKKQVIPNIDLKSDVQYFWDILLIWHPVE
jgi:hypothetical protein